MLPFLRIGDFYLATYGILVALAFLAALWIIGRLSKQAGVDKDAATNLAIYAALAGILGSKALMIAFDYEYYSRNLWELFSLTTLQAGGIFFGGLIAALATAFVYMWRKKMPALKTADVIAPGLALGHGIGRLGCFTAGCCWGASCDLPWAVTFTHPEAERRFGTPLHTALHPTQIYEALAEFAIFAFLYWRFQRAHGPGAIVGLYLVLYPAARFVIEFVRAHDKANPHLGPFVTEQWFAIGLMALGFWLLRKSRRTA
jgi:phosphatidylglycerol:prolipoprotein diacylglycerol transferase